MVLDLKLAFNTSYQKCIFVVLVNNNWVDIISCCGCLSLCFPTVLQNKSTSVLLQLQPSCHFFLRSFKQKVKLDLGNDE